MEEVGDRWLIVFISPDDRESRNIVIALSVARVVPDWAVIGEDDEMFIMQQTQGCIVPPPARSSATGVTARRKTARGRTPNNQAATPQCDGIYTSLA